ncbi:MAG: AAA family ATPase [Deltaproteobacteria bacterium]|nr:AAA family ATPase [Deltaproteobacteria bacterium]
MKYKEIPLNITDFVYMREHGCLYVDKTSYIEKLLDRNDKYFLLLRPKSFGKTVFLNTLDAFFSGREELFRGLYIHDKVRIFEKFPVIKLNMALATRSTEILIESLTSRLLVIAEEMGVELRYQNNPSEALFWLIKDTRKKFGKRIVVLIDEYDKPVLDHLFEAELGYEIRRIMRDFYLVLREAEPYLHFIYLTGTAKYSQTAMNPYMSNAIDLTFLDEFSTAFGYTREEFITYFSDRFEPLLEKLIKAGKYGPDDSIVDLRNDILDFYDVFSWNGRKKVFSPHSINRYFYLGGPNELLFKADSPRLLKNIFGDDIESFIATTFQNYTYDDFCRIDVGTVNKVALMFYTGYLTVEQVYNVNSQFFYNLRIQNYEKNHEFCSTLYDFIFAHKTHSEMDLYMKHVVYAIRTQNAQALEAMLSDLFFNLPMILKLKSLCVSGQLDINADDIDIHAPSPKNYDYFDTESDKKEELVFPSKDFPAAKYMKNVSATRFNDRFDIIFQTSIQAFFEGHGFLTKPGILRANRETHMECGNKYETFLIKTTNVKPNGKNGDSICKTLLNEAKQGLEFINNQTRGQKCLKQATRVSKIGLAISPFDKIKVAFSQ